MIPSHDMTVSNAIRYDVRVMEYLILFAEFNIKTMLFIEWCFFIPVPMDNQRFVCDHFIILSTIVWQPLYTHWYLKLPNSILFNECWQYIAIILFDFTHQQQHDKRKCDLLSEPLQKGHPSFSFKWQISSFSVINVINICIQRCVCKPASSVQSENSIWWILNAWIMWHVIQYIR